MTTKTFHIGDILSVTTGCLVSPRHMDGIYDLLNFMTGDSLFTHQLPRVGRECAPELLRQFPDLASVRVPDMESEEQVFSWLATQVAEFGESREVQPLAAGDHTSIDPLAELKMMRPDMPIVGVVMDEESK